MHDIEAFKAKIRQAITLAKARGHTQAQIAEAAGVTPQAVGQWKNKGKISSANLALLARLAGKSVEWFYTTTGDEPHESVQDRLKALMEDEGWSENELARQSGVPQPTIHRILTGESESPRTDNLQKLAHALGVSSSYLSYGEAGYSEPGQPSNIKEAPQPLHYHRYPVISRVQAGAWTEAVAPYAPGAEPHLEATDYRARGKAFWLEVQGDSMTAPAGARPSIPEGTLVLFDTGVEPAPGKLVAALLADSNEATFKQLIEDGGQRYLKALNPAYPLIPINGNCRILGVAVEAKTRL